MYKRKTNSKYRREKYSDDNLLFLFKSAVFFLSSFVTATIYLKAITILVVKSSWPYTMMGLAVFITIVLGLWLFIISNPKRLKADWGALIDDDFVMLVAVGVWVALLPTYLVIPALANLYRGLGFK